MQSDTAGAPSAELDDFLAQVRQQFRQQKTLAEKALAQTSDVDFFRQLDAENNSLAVLTKHIGGNLRSRWRDFLTTDGQKADRFRDGEFVVDGDTRASILALWEDGWAIALATLDSLTTADLGKTVTIRQQPHTVIEAILRGLGHVAYHIGQIVQLARHFAGDRWQTLSIPRGQSDRYDAMMREKFSSSES